MEEKIKKIQEEISMEIESEKNNLKEMISKVKKDILKVEEDYDFYGSFVELNRIQRDIEYILRRREGLDFLFNTDGELTKIIKS